MSPLQGSSTPSRVPVYNKQGLVEWNRIRVLGAAEVGRDGRDGHVADVVARGGAALLRGNITEAEAEPYLDALSGSRSHGCLVRHSV